MKKSIFSTILIAILFVVRLSAQDAMAVYSHALKISPFQLGQSQLELGYEYYFANQKSSLQLMPSIYLKEGSRESFSGFQLEGQYRFKIIDLKKGVNKTWIFSGVQFFGGPYLLGSTYKSDYFSAYTDQFGVTTDREYTDEVNSIEGGAILGFKLEIAKRILLEFTTGGGVRFPETTTNFEPGVDNYYYYNDPNVFDQKYKGVKPKVNFQIGFSF